MTAITLRSRKNWPPRIHSGRRRGGSNPAARGPILSSASWPKAARFTGSVCARSCLEVALLERGECDPHKRVIHSKEPRIVFHETPPRHIDDEYLKPCRHVFRDEPR